MKQLRRNIQIFIVVFLALFLLFTAGVVLQSQKARTTLLSSSGENRAALAQRYSQAGTIYSSDDVILAYSGDDGVRSYSDDPILATAALHLVGDYTHNIGYTIESLWQNELLGQGRSFSEQLILDFQGKGMQGNDLRLTVRSDLMKTAYKLLDGNSGSAVVLNYKTGEVLAAVSSPSVHPDQVVAWRDIPDSSLYNRALFGAYVPGSTFKIVTTEAILEEGISTTDTVFCKGTEALIPGGVNEMHENAGHGEVNLQSAFAWSCNHYFGQAGLELGPVPIMKAAEDMGFNKNIELDRFPVYKSICSIGKEDDAALTWAAIGQAAGDDTVLISPLHLALISAMVANNGRMIQPYVVDSLIYPSKYEVNMHEEKTVIAEIDQKNASELTALMRQVVVNGTGGKAGVSGLEVCGKTGTAEVYDTDGKLVSSSRFTGFSSNPDYPYAVAVILDYSSSGSAAIAGQLLAAAARD